MFVVIRVLKVVQLLVLSVGGTLKVQSICHAGRGAFNQSGTADFFGIRSFGKIASNGAAQGGINFNSSKSSCGNYVITFKKLLEVKIQQQVITCRGNVSP